MARKRTRPTEDVDGSGEEEEVEIESASSSFRQSNPAVKRNQTALAREAGRQDAFDDLLQSDNATEADDEPEPLDSPTIDADFEHSLHNVDSDMEDEDDEIDEYGLTQHIGKKFKERRENVAMDEGIIEEVSCRNFMCHSKLRITLGPNINFIIGHNGSGKSAVLTALTMCLGGRAASTNRGGNLRSMIKEGTDSAMLGVKIKNTGENAYKHAEYGDSIIVERHFTRGGTSGFKLKTGDGKNTISTKKADLDDILDYFGLQMDNPINVLTQDMARQFLANSTASEKYKFFLRGTQLEALDADYKVFEEHLDAMRDRLRVREDDIAVLQQKFKDAERKKKQADGIEQVRLKMMKASHQSAWAQVEEQERRLEGLKDKVVDAERQVEEAEENVQMIDGDFDGHDAACEAAQRVVDEHQEKVGPAEGKHQQEKARLDENKQLLLNLKAEQRNQKEEYQKACNEEVRLQGEIATEEGRLSEAGGDQHIQRERQLESLRDKAREAKEAESEHESSKQAVQDEVVNAEKHLKDTKFAYEKADEARRAAEQRLKALDGDQRDKYKPYPPRTDQLLREIDRETRWERKPVGPIGMHVQLQKPEWSSILEKTFGGTLNSFVVMHKDDQVRLGQIAKRIGCNVTILINNRAALPALNEPEEGVDTILRCLTIDDEEVKKALIIQTSIEQTVLVRDNERGQAYFQKENRNVKAVLSFAARRDCGIRYDWSRTHAIRSSPIQAWEGLTRMKTDVAEQKRHQEETVERARRDVEKASESHRQAQTRHKKAREALERHKRQARQLLTKRQQAEDDVEAKKGEIDENAPEDGRLQELQRLLESAKGDKRSAKESLEDSFAALNRLNEDAKRLKAVADTALAELNEAQARVNEARERLRGADTARHDKLLEKNAAHDDLEIQRENLRRMQGKLDDQQKLLDEEFIAGAEQVCPRIPVPQGETAESLSTLCATYRHQIENAERRQGGTREELTRAWKEASDDLQRAKGEIENFTRLAAVSLL